MYAQRFRKATTYLVTLAFIVASCTSITSEITATPTASITPSPTFTSTPTPTLTLRPTTTPTLPPTETPIPTETPKPVFTWEMDFEHFRAGFSDDFGRTTTKAGVPGNTINSYFEIVDDPTDSNHGKVYRGIVSGPSIFENGVSRPYPDLYFPFLNGSFSTELDVFLYSGFRPPSIGNRYSAQLNLISLFDFSDPEWHPSVMVNLDSGRLLTFSVYPNGEALFFKQLKNAPHFPINQWVHLRVDVDITTKKVRTYQDGFLVSEGDYVAERLGTVGGHWGLYGYGLTNITLLNDNIALYVYPTSSP